MVENLIQNSSDQNRKELYKFSDKIFYFNDNGTGSFGFVYSNDEYIGGGKYISDVYFYDADNILCIATMYAYSNNFVDSIDIWKVDFSKLIQIPTKNECFLSIVQKRMF